MTEPLTTEDICRDDCTSGCHATDCEHHGHPAATPLNDARERELAEEAIEYGYTHVEVDPHRLLATLDALRATPTPDTRLREALLSIIGEAEEVTEAQHGTPHGALYAIIRRAREALADD